MRSSEFGPHNQEFKKVEHKVLASNLSNSPIEIEAALNTALIDIISR